MSEESRLECVKLAKDMVDTDTIRRSTPNNVQTTIVNILSIARFLNNFVEKGQVPISSPGTTTKQPKTKKTYE